MNEVASAILAQLGGNQFCAMTGAKHFVQSADMLQFNIGRNPKRVTKVQIKLTNADLYTMAFYRWNARTATMTKLATVNGLYADQLQTTFTAETGLYTRL